jgi:uncharacterized protein (TIGR00297 family)
LLLGTVVFGIGGIPWAILLLIFFITSSLLSRAFKKRKQGLEEKYSKGHERDAGQVFANGGLGMLFVLIHELDPGSNIAWVGFAASLAAVNADTWATELGVLNPTPPRLITDLRKRVEKGTSGGISLTGTLASLAGAVVITAASLLTYNGAVPDHPRRIAGSLFDHSSATVAMYFCPTDNKETEKHPFHTCGKETIHIRGWRWLTNDWVNFTCAVFGTVIALLL